MRSTTSAALSVLLATGSEPNWASAVNSAYVHRGQSKMPQKQVTGCHLKTHMCFLPLHARFSMLHHCGRKKTLDIALTGMPTISRWIFSTQLSTRGLPDLNEAIAPFFHHSAPQMAVCCR